MYLGSSANLMRLLDFCYGVTESWRCTTWKQALQPTLSKLTKLVFWAGPIYLHLTLSPLFCFPIHISMQVLLKLIKCVEGIWLQWTYGVRCPSTLLSKRTQSATDIQWVRRHFRKKWIDNVLGWNLLHVLQSYSSTLFCFCEPVSAVPYVVVTFMPLS